MVSGPAAGLVLPIGTKPFVIGRGEAEPGALGGDPEVSRRHAQISAGGDGGLTVEDLGSTNGTFVNGRRIERPTAVAAGDALWVGTTTMQVIGPQAQPSLSRVVRLQGGVSRSGQELVRLLDQRAPVPPPWILNVFLLATGVSLVANFLIALFATKVLDVPTDLGPLEPPRLVLATVIPIAANSMGFMKAFGRPGPGSLGRYLVPTFLISALAATLNLLSLEAGADTISVVTAVVVTLLPLAIVVPLLLSLPARARQLPPPIARG